MNVESKILRLLDKNICKDVVDLLFVKLTKNDRLNHKYVLVIPKENKNFIPIAAFENSSVKYVIVDKSIIELKKCAFSNCSKLKKIVIYNNLVKIGSETFTFCSNLEYLVLPKSLIRIPPKMCQFSGLKMIEIGNNIVSIGELAFSECFNLEKVIIGDSLKRINDWSFSDCENLTFISLGRNIVYIGTGSFKPSYLSLNKMGNRKYDYRYINTIEIYKSNENIIKRHIIMDYTNIIYKD